MDHLPLGLGGGLSSKRRPARQHLIEQRAEGVDVRGRPDRPRLPDDLLGSHVARSPHPSAAQSQCCLFFELPGQTEISDLGRTLGREQDVARLQVAVHDSSLVRHLHGLGEHDQERGRLPGCGVPASAWARLPPSRSSIVKKGQPSWSPTS